ncbi:putative Mg2+ transporter protein [Paratrimastix pyriformis]|uniref:Mg2+ transporter protein n=1 Tax=Paratrimastix pyriformis TaxID=342808 RepID=A0ABQ8UL99_9EUKA|nr:putative Mg2+ transporter protein [Paratrimastix pyriformis]
MEQRFRRRSSVMSLQVESLQDEFGAPPASPILFKILVCTTSAVGQLHSVNDLRKFLQTHPPKTGSPIWIDFSGSATPHQMEDIAALFGLHPLTATDCFKVDSSPKWELFDRYLFVVLSSRESTFEGGGTGTTVKSGSFSGSTEIELVLFPHLILSFHKERAMAPDLVLEWLRCGASWVSSSGDTHPHLPQTLARHLKTRLVSSQPLPTPRPLDLEPEVVAVTAPLLVSSPPSHQIQPTLSPEAEVPPPDSSEDAAVLSLARSVLPYQTAILGAPLHSELPETPRIPHGHHPSVTLPQTDRTTTDSGPCPIAPPPFYVISPAPEPPYGSIPPPEAATPATQRKKATTAAQSQQAPHLRPQEPPPGPTQGTATKDTHESALMNPDFVFYLLFDACVNSYSPLVDGALAEVDSLEDLVQLLPKEEQNDLLLRFAVDRRYLASLRRKLVPAREILGTLCSREIPFVTQDIRRYLRDILDHTIFMLDKIDMAREALTSSHNSYLAQLSIDLGRASNDMNCTMRELNVVATALLPLSVIAGCLGMNLPIPFQESKSYVPFSVTTGLMFVLGVGAIIFFKKRHWL